jgi:EmrB/QacA subfamily drug resistance transporter
MQIRSQQGRRQRLAVTLLAGAAFLSGLDLFVVNVAFDDIARAVGAGTPGGPRVADVSWILTAYAVVFAAFLVPLGRVADKWGHKPVFLAGVSVFTAASLACAATGDLWFLVAARAVQAIGAAAMTPTSLSLLLAVLPPEARARGVRTWASAGAIAAAVGPSVGGLLTQLDWRLVFVINLPVGLLVLALAATRVPATPREPSAAMPDFLSAGIFAMGIGALALALVRAPEWGWASTRVLALAAVAVVFVAVVAVRSRRHPAPLVSPALLRVRTFRWAVVGTLVYSVAFGANLLVGVLWLQQVWGWSPLLTGLAIAPGPALVPVTVWLTHRYLPNLQAATAIGVGSLLMAFGVALRTLSMGESTHYATAFLPGWMIAGVGVGLALPHLMSAATHDLPPTWSATGSGVVTMSRQLGLVLGTSMLFALVGNDVGLDAVPAFRAAWWVCVAALLLTAALTPLIRPRSAPSLAPLLVVDEAA